MKKLAILTAATAVAAFATPAMAQDAAPTVETYVGASAGYHDLGIGDDLKAFGIDGKDGGFIYGVVGGVDIPVGDQGLKLGLEGNFHLGSDAIDSDYGIATKLGYDLGSTTVYVKGGYQWVNIDVDQLTGGALSDSQFRALGEDDTFDDYLVGAGAQIDLGTNAYVNVGIDTISFDTVRGTVGVGFKF